MKPGQDASHGSPPLNARGLQEPCRYRGGDAEGSRGLSRRGKATKCGDRRRRTGPASRAWIGAPGLELVDELCDPRPGNAPQFPILMLRSWPMRMR